MAGHCHSCVCAKSLPSCPTLCGPMDCSPPGFSVHGNSPGKNTGVGCPAHLQGIFLTEGLNLCLLCLRHWQVLYHWRQLGSPLVPTPSWGWTHSGCLGNSRTTKLENPGAAKGSVPQDSPGISSRSPVWAWPSWKKTCAHIFSQNAISPTEVTALKLTATVVQPPMRKFIVFPIVPGRESKAQRGRVTCSRSHSRLQLHFYLPILLLAGRALGCM